MNPNDLVYPRERTLGALTLTLGLLFWLLLLVGTFGLLLVYLLAGLLLYAFAHSAFISYIKGDGIKLSAQQFPDLHQRYLECCRKLDIAEPPEAYVMQGGGMLNAFATRFFGRNFVVLLSDVIDAMDKHPDGVNFYIGHELGHVRMKHLTGRLWRWPSLWIPLLGAAYARAQESTCDRHGLACSSSPENAARALAALAAGHKRWATVHLGEVQAQAQQSGSFWMSYHELTGTYPWLSKRIARVMDLQAQLPGRHAFAYVLALFVPNSGRMAGATGPAITVAVIGVLAAVAIPKYQDYQVRAKLAAAYGQAQAATVALGEHFLATGEVPSSLKEVGIDEDLPGGGSLRLGDGMELTVHTDQGSLVLTPTLDEAADALADPPAEAGAMQDATSSSGDAAPAGARGRAEPAVNGRLVWNCRAGDDTPARQVPSECRTGLGSLLTE